MDAANDVRPTLRPIRHLRWWIATLLLVSTIINYLDRQTLSVLAPYLKAEYRWTNTDFATILIAFRMAYTIMQSVAGRLLDRFGTRVGLAVSVSFYSAMAMLGAAASGLWSFRFFRFLLGCGEAGNWPGAAKCVAEWFPARERAWAVAMFDSGSAIGGAIAPLLVVTIYQYTHRWQPVMVLIGALGFVWVVAWLVLYRRPEEHPRLAPEELALITNGRSAEPADAGPPVTWRELLRLRQTWGIILGRALMDPYWFLVAEWFGVYLVAQGMAMDQVVGGYWVPFIAADLGNFFGAGLSSYWIRRGWPVGKARRTTLLIFGPCLLALIPAAYSANFLLILALFAIATFSYACCATMFLSLPGDVFRDKAVATVSGLSGTGAGLMTLLSTYLTGRVADTYSFRPILIVASLVPCVATFILVAWVRQPKESRRPDLFREF